MRAPDLDLEYIVLEALESHGVREGAALENEDAKRLRQLRRALRHSPTSWLHPLLVDLMLRDTAKHIEILEHIETQLTKG